MADGHFRERERSRASERAREREIDTERERERNRHRHRHRRRHVQTQPQPKPKPQNSHTHTHKHRHRHTWKARCPISPNFLHAPRLAREREIQTDRHIHIQTHLEGKVPDFTTFLARAALS